MTIPITSIAFASEAEAYRVELKLTPDLNPALPELMFARHIMNKLESQVP